jgi:hypothetical protein
MRAVTTYWRFRAALWLWARLVPVLAWRSDIASLLQRVSPQPGTPYRGLPAHLIAYRARRSVRRPRFMKDRPCLREGVLADRFLRLAGYRPELHFGVERQSVTQDKLAAHCWVVLDDAVILNRPTTAMIEVLVRDKYMSLRRPAAAEPCN